MKRALFAMTLSAVMLGAVATAEDAAVQPQATQSMIPVETPAMTPVAPVSTDPASLSGTVTQTVQAPLTAKDYMMMTQEVVPVRNNLLSKKYQAYKITLKNQKPVHLEVVMGEVTNGLDEAFVANQELERKNNNRRMAGGLLKGLSSVPFMGGFGYASVGAYRAAAIGSQLATTAGNVAEATAQNNMANVEGRYLNRINSTVISPGESYTFTALVGKNETPQMRLVFKAMETNQIFNLNH